MTSVPLAIVVEEISCPKCPTLFASMELCVAHALETHAPKNQADHVCVFCDKGFTSREGLKLHYRSVHLKVWNRKQCKQCRIVFETHKALHEHRKSQHPTPKSSIQCPTCNRSFSSLRRLEIHQLHFDGENSEGLLPCRYCPKLFSLPTIRNRHEAECHTLKDRYQCTFEGCTQTFYRQSQYKQHMEMHEQKRDYKCPSCVKSYASANSLRRHIANFHSTLVQPPTANDDDDGKIQCPECTHRLRPSSIKGHIRIFHDPRNQRNNRAIKCRQCNFSALQQLTLDLHIAQHHPSNDE